MYLHRKNTKERTPKVALLIDTSRAYWRRLLRGVVKYSRLHGPWLFYRGTPYYRKHSSKAEEISRRLKKWGANGIIIHDVERNKQLISMGLPTIVTNVNKKNIGLPCIIGDNKAIGRMAAEYFLNLGFRHFAFCGFDNMFWSQDRGEGFCNRARKAGFETKLYEQSKSKTQRLWESEQFILAKWLKSVPKPVALLACNDDRAQNVADACKIAGLYVPEEVAILGVDNEDLTCELSDPPLSSIVFNAERAGYEAAELLNRLMAGEEMANQQVPAIPIHIVTRQSTNVLATKDIQVVEAVRFIHRHASRAIQVNDVAHAVALSRRALERQFRKTLGRSVFDEIKRVHVEKLGLMLTQTNLTVSQIASSLGYVTVDHIARYFRREKGMSPLTYRKKYGMK